MKAEHADSNNSLIQMGQWLQPRLSWTSGQLDVIKTVAMLLMVIDHVNRIFALDHRWMMWLGRGAFPLFGVVWAYNLMRHSTLRQASLNHLWVWALFAQLGYALAGFPWWQGNILFAFAVAGQAIRWCEMKSRLSVSLGLLLVALWLPFAQTSYELAGILMLASARYLFAARSSADRAACFLLWCSMVLMLNIEVSPIATIAGLILSAVVLALSRLICTSVQRFWLRDFFVLFYVGHLVLLSVLAGVIV
ncbi:type-F conjugative transfer system pilin acetylase TraX [Hafnia paralvei]|uniref:type-F conjugative transfer system pilin acetylase TraX n=1 Tax=Hafnia paralvei TaxID=546367 RepID=UPI001FFF5A0B|nr:type-F conjugative transfer system pilin acetylase TraX [Hafnia paralvei]MCK2179555.1 type-F conjugative transfer system pilin acetylase TraX [Hafnia paralvei]